MNEFQQREAIVNEALSWVGTPFIEKGMVKGEKGGVDCARLICAVFSSAIGHHSEIPKMEDGSSVSLQYNLHCKEGDEVYLKALEKWGWLQTDGHYKRRGDLLVPKLGRIYWHGGIVVKWPFVVTAHCGLKKVIQCNAEVDDLFIGRSPLVYSLWSTR